MKSVLQFSPFHGRLMHSLFDFLVLSVFSGTIERPASWAIDYWVHPHILDSNHSIGLRFWIIITMCEHNIRSMPHWVLTVLETNLLYGEFEAFVCFLETFPSILELHWTISEVRKHCLDHRVAESSYKKCLGQKTKILADPRNVMEGREGFGRCLARAEPHRA